MSKKYIYQVRARQKVLRCKTRRWCGFLVWWPAVPVTGCDGGGSKGCCAYDVVSAEIDSAGDVVLARQRRNKDKLDKQEKKRPCVDCRPLDVHL